MMQKLLLNTKLVAATLFITMGGNAWGSALEHGQSQQADPSTELEPAHSVQYIKIERLVASSDRLRSHQNQTAESYRETIISLRTASSFSETSGTIDLIDLRTDNEIIDVYLGVQDINTLQDANDYTPSWKPEGRFYDPMETDVAAGIKLKF